MFDAHHDPGIGNGTAIVLDGGERKGAHVGAQQLIESFRRRHPGVSATQLASLMCGCSNGWCSIRLVAASGR